MYRILRIVALAVIALLMVNLVVIGIGSHDTGPAEKVVLGLVGIVLLLAAYKVGAAGRRSRSA